MDLSKNIPEEYRQIYEKNWKTIKPSIKKGLIKDVHHSPLFSDNHDEILARLEETLNSYEQKIKINVGFGFILRERLTNELKFFHPSNNTTILKVPKLISNDEDRKELEEEIEQNDIFEYARKQRPSTKWKVEKIICIRFDIYKLN